MGSVLKRQWCVPCWGGTGTQAVFDTASTDKCLSPSTDSKPESSSSPLKEPPSGVCHLKHHISLSHALESVGAIVL